MFYFLIIPFFVLLLCFWLGNKNKKKLKANETELLKKLMFQDSKVFSFLSTALFSAIFPLYPIFGRITPFPFWLLMTIIFAWAFVIRLNIYQSNLPKSFVKTDNILSSIQFVALLSFYYFLFNFDLTK